MRRFFLHIIMLGLMTLALAQSLLLPDRVPISGKQMLLADSLTGPAIPELPDSLTTPNDSSAATITGIQDRIPILPDSASTQPDSTKRTRLGRINYEKTDLDGTVTFSAKDSLILIGQNNAYLYGDGTVEYQDFQLNAAEIRMELDSATVHANGVLDSVGKLSATPIFKDKGGEYQSQTMKYNFKTQRGFITDVVTEQGEGYLLASKTKKMEDGSFYVENGRYTTCNDHEHPHFYFNITKGRMRPKKDVVSGPVYMVLADVPLPLALPFGYFPFSKDYSSGIIFPSFGEDYQKGFYMRNGGYYFAINDYVDLALRGEIYTKGSWGISATSSYVKRYRFRGNFDLSFINTVTGDKGMPDYSRMNNFQVIWSHSQDTKANPNMNFSASVNFTTSGYTRNDLNSYYSNAFTENTKSSTVSLTYRFPGTKWSLATTLNISQRTQDSTLAVSFPNLTVSMSQTTPFKRKKSVGGERWYEKIRMSYQGQFQNSLTANQNQFFHKSLIKDWRNGLKHSLPISATFSLFKYINVSPSISINDRMYTNKVRRQWDANASAEVCDTTYGFYNVFDFQASLSLDTKLYGFYKPMKFLGDKVQMIRHVLTPTVTFSAAPDFSAPIWGVYGRYDYTDAAGNPQTRVYSQFPNTIFGVPGQGKSGLVSVNLGNNVEMKIKDENDSTGVRKISLIENFSIGQSYNFAADSMNWSNISTNLLLRLPKNISLNLNATWDPYTYALSPGGSPVKVNVPRWKAHKGWARLSSTGTSFSYTFNNDTFRRKKKDDKSAAANREEDEDPDTEDETFAEAAAKKRNRRDEDERVEADADGYAAWSCPWSLTLNYSVSYGYGEFNYDKMEFKGKWTQNLSMSGNIRPTKNWNFSFSASYNFDTHKIAYMNCSVSRDLHCFTMTASFIPVGPYKSYNFHIAVKSSLLKDIKYDKRSSSYNGLRWY